MLTRNNRGLVLSADNLSRVKLIWTLLPTGTPGKRYTGHRGRERGEDSRSQGLAMLPLPPLQTQFPCLYLDEVVPNPSYIPPTPFHKLPPSGGL